MSVAGTTDYPTALDTSTTIPRQANSVSTLLNDLTIDAAAITFTVVSAASFPTTGIFRIEDEFCIYTGKTGTTLTGITRGAFGSTAAAHATGTAVKVTVLAQYHNVLADAVIAIETKLGTGAAIDAAKIGAGTVSSTEFGYLDGVTSAIQTQINAITGGDYKQSVRVATTANGTLATAYENGDTVDGAVLATGDRILLKNQTTGSENGIYTVNASGAPTRATDFDTSAEVTAGCVIPVEEGTANADSLFILTTNNPITISSTSLSFSGFGPSTGITALTGDVTASGSGSVAATLATVNSNVGSFTNANLTVNAKGLITAAANGSGGSGATAALDNLASVAINTALLTGAGVAAAFTATAPAATTGASQAGIAASLTASVAVASTDTNGAANGGSVTITGGAAARRTSGNGNGGSISLVPGAAIGSGTEGQVLIGVNGDTTHAALAFSSAPNYGIANASSGIQIIANGTNTWGFYSTGVKMANDQVVDWSESSSTAGTTDIRLIRFTTATLRLGGDSIGTTPGKLLIGRSDASMVGHFSTVGRTTATTGVTDLASLCLDSDNTPAATYGAQLRLDLKSSTTNQQQAAGISWLWTTATHASRTADLYFSTVNSGTVGEVFRMTGGGLPVFNSTVTAGGTTGNQTINKASGTVNIAAAGTSVTVTNSLVTTSSIVFTVIRTNDSTATIKNVVPGSGSFVITLTAAATAEISIGFFVINQ